MAEWIIPFDTKVYRFVDALKELKSIDWRKPSNFKSVRDGDNIYIYISSISQIVYKGAVLNANKSQSTIDDSDYSIISNQNTTGKYMEIAVFRVYDIPGLDIDSLKENGLKTYLEEPIKATPILANYLHSCDDIQRKYDESKKVVPETCLVPFPIEIIEEGVNKDISLSPIEISDNGYIVKCRLCGMTFAKSAKRCPNCGQLIRYPDRPNISEFEMYGVNSGEGLLKYLLNEGFSVTYPGDLESSQSFIRIRPANIYFHGIKAYEPIRVDCKLEEMKLIEKKTGLKHYDNKKGDFLPYGFCLNSFKDLRSVVEALEIYRTWYRI